MVGKVEEIEEIEMTKKLEKVLECWRLGLPLDKGGWGDFGSDCFDFPHIVSKK
jgi:hypothetical protein